MDYAWMLYLMNRRRRILEVDYSDSSSSSDSESFSASQRKKCGYSSPSSSSTSSLTSDPDSETELYKNTMPNSGTSSLQNCAGSRLSPRTMLLLRDRKSEIPNQVRTSHHSQSGSFKRPSPIDKKDVDKYKNQKILCQSPITSSHSPSPANKYRKMTSGQTNSVPQRYPLSLHNSSSSSSYLSSSSSSSTKKAPAVPLFCTPGSQLAERPKSSNVRRNIFLESGHLVTPDAPKKENKENLLPRPYLQKQERLVTGYQVPRDIPNIIHHSKIKSSQEKEHKGLLNQKVTKDTGKLSDREYEILRAHFADDPYPKQKRLQEIADGMRLPLEKVKKYFVGRRGTVRQRLKQCGMDVITEWDIRKAARPDYVFRRFYSDMSSDAWSSEDEESDDEVKEAGGGKYSEILFDIGLNLVSNAYL